MIIEFFGGLFSLFAISRVILRLKEGKISLAMAAVWSLVWATLIAFLASPKSFEPLSQAIGIQRPLDLMLVLSITVSYYLIFRVYIMLEDLRGDLAVVAREIALKKR